MKTDHGSRWVVAAAGLCLQMALGTVYAWSYFQKPVMDAYGWKNVDVMWIFSLAICFLGLAAAVGGMLMVRVGPFRLALAGAFLYGCGYLLAAQALALKSLPLLYVGFGMMGGMGLGLGYVTPVATVAKWFPDKKGFVTGMVIMGFGLGALFMSKVMAPVLMRIFAGDLVQVFRFAGIALLAIGMPSAACMRNPPAGFTASGMTGVPAVPPHERLWVPDHVLGTLCSSRFFRMWLLLFLNTSAGIMFVGLQSPMLQDMLLRSGRPMTGVQLAQAGATLIAVSSIFNGVGRFFWGGLSDHIGRTRTFLLIFSTQAVVFLALIWTPSPWLFSILVCYVLLCYGGGFGTMPSYVGDVFGVRMMPVIYGAILTAWSAAGIVGPPWAAFLTDRFAGAAPVYTYSSGAVLLVLGFLITLTLDDRPLGSRLPAGS